MIASGKLRVRIVRGRMVVELSENILFDSGRADLKTEGQTALTEVAGGTLVDPGPRLPDRWAHRQRADQERAVPVQLGAVDCPRRDSDELPETRACPGPAVGGRLRGDTSRAPANDTPRGARRTGASRSC